jgi:Cytochrome C and Quinol oxidase polypeptide I
VPRLWKRERLYSLRLVTYHFWISTIGIVLYITAMWISGIMQGLMWRAYDHLGFLQYSFIETVEAMHPYYVIRAAGGTLFLLGSLIMGLQPLEDDPRRGPHRSRLRAAGPGLYPRRRVREGRSMQLSHAPFEKNVIILIVGILITVSIGGLVQLVPLFTMEQTSPPGGAGDAVMRHHFSVERLAEQGSIRTETARAPTGLSFKIAESARSSGIQYLTRLLLHLQIYECHPDALVCLMVPTQTNSDYMLSIASSTCPTLQICQSGYRSTRSYTLLEIRPWQYISRVYCRAM